MPESFFPDFTLGRPGEITISPWSAQSLGVSCYTMGLGALSGQNFVATNRAIFVPFFVPETVVINKMGWINGAAVAGNIDVGLFDEAGVRVVSSGSTAQTTTGVAQIVDVADATLRRGRYYLAMSSDTAGATQKIVSVIPAAGIVQSLGVLQMAAAFALPANATYAKCTSAFLPIIIAQGYRTVGP